MPSIAVEQIGFSYRRARTPVLEDFSLDVREGELVGLVGPSGCGKSTLLFIIGLMITPDSGRVALLGQDFSNASERRRALFRATKIGFIFQDYLLDPTRTLLDNVLEVGLYQPNPEPKEARRKRAAELLLRMGIDVEVTRRAANLSGGQSQRVAVCRALLSRPSIVLADEPTGNLDADSARVVMSELQNQAERGATVLVVTHNPESLPPAARLVRLG